MSLLLGALCAFQIAAARPEPAPARTAQELLARARAARYQQDSALQDYTAMAKQRWTARLGVAPGLGLGPVSRLRLGARLETVARVGWHHVHGAWAEVIGARAVAPIVGEVEPEIVDDEFAVTLPYHPGRDRLWPTDELVEALPGRDGLFAHPLDPANDSLYRFDLGEPVDITLPGGRRIGLRELLVRPVRPDERLIVGSLWVDASSGALVRAAYRPSVAVDLWPYMEPNFEDDEDEIIGKFGPFEGKVEEILIEHGLYEERFWLPRVRIAHAEGTAKGGRVTMSIEQTFEYERVRALPPGVAQAPQPHRDSLRRWTADDHEAEQYRYVEFHEGGRWERRRTDACRETGDSTAPHLVPDSIATRRDLHTDSTVEGIRVRILYPCDLRTLATSPSLPPSIYSPSEELFTETDLADVRREVQQALALSSQADWAPQPTKLRYGLDRGLLRYNRIEGLSAGVIAEREFGKGYTGDALLRIGTADLEPNAELTLRRANGHRDLRVSAYRRLEPANAWGNPLGIAASLNALLLGRDDAFYHRATGAELGGTHRRISGAFALSWRLFAEQHDAAEVGTTFSMARVVAGSPFAPNPPAVEGIYSGAAAILSFGAGSDPRGTQLSATTHLEGADGPASYGRAAIDLRLAQGLFERTTLSVTGAAGTSIGTLPSQRHWYLGGAQTIHAHRPGTMSGDGFWFARAELTRGMPLIRPILFADVGWAGDRRDWLTSRDRLSAAGIGAAALDGLVRVDLSRSLDGTKRWSFDIFLELR